MITEEKALEIATKLVPDIKERFYCSVSLSKPPRLKMFGGIPDDCWYITYSVYTKDSGFIVNVGEGIFINKYSGEIIFKGTLNNEG